MTIITHLGMSEQRTTLSQFPPREKLWFEGPADPFWRLGDVVALGKPFPTLIERGSHPTQHQLPITSWAARSEVPLDNQFRLARAVIPVSAIFLRSDGPASDRRRLDVSDRNTCAFIMAFAERGVRPGHYNDTVGLMVPSGDREAKWIDQEPLVVFGQQAAQWLSGRTSLSEIRPENHFLVERHQRLAAL